MNLSEAQIWLLDFLKERYHPLLVLPEYKFYQARKWKFDVAIPGKLLAFEIEGGIWTNGAHVRGKHFLSDAEKYNFAAATGWRVFRFAPEQVLKGEAKKFIQENL